MEIGGGVRSFFTPSIRIDFREASHYLKLAAAQYSYGLSLYKGEGVGIDFRGAGHCFKLAADQGVADGQSHYGLCLRKVERVGIHFEGAAHYLKLRVWTPVTVRMFPISIRVCAHNVLPCKSFLRSRQ
jgi:hypothetical protein